MKSCKKCYETKRYDSFFRRKTIKNWDLSICKKCHKSSPEWDLFAKEKSRNYQLKQNYRITFNEYEEFAKFCNYECSICLKPQDKFKNKLDIDHDHSNGIIRGLLCSNCNKGLGLFEDNISIMESAIQYLMESAIQYLKDYREELNAVKAREERCSIQA